KKGKRLNEGFTWEAETGYQAAHVKYYLPDEEGFWEATWYERGNREFLVTQTGRARIGFLICTELWFNAHARCYGKQGIHILVCPRATPKSTTDKWVAGGRTAAVVSGAFCLSANFGHSTSHNVQWGGTGWIIEPGEGNVLALTSPQQPFVTLEIDLNAAEQAKHTYPRYVLD
ncbi:MAG: carbon-nitrogen hydrolase family protein, partial [Candidatus Aminicenantes bacterium]